MKRTLLAVVWAGCAWGQATGVQVLDATAQQIRVRYLAANATDACVGKISKKAALTPPAFDVDSVRFPGQEQDLNRLADGAVANGVERTFVFGRRYNAISPVDGYTYSLSLQEATTYYGSITCPGGAAVTFTATTKSIPVGIGYGERVRSNPATNFYLWASNSPVVSEEVVDATTGALLYLPKKLWLTGSGNGSTGPGGVGFGQVTGSGWSCDSGNCVSDAANADGSYVTTTGTGWLFLGVNASATSGVFIGDTSFGSRMAWQNLVLSASCAGSDCPAQVEVEVTRLGMGPDGFRGERPGRKFTVGAGADTTVVVCKDAPCTTPNAPGDHMTDQQVPMRNTPYPADGRLTYTGVGGVYNLTNGNDCARLGTGEWIQMFAKSGLHGNEDTLFDAPIVGKDCNAVPATVTIPQWRNIPRGGVETPVVDDETNFFYESGLYYTGSSSALTPQSYNPRYGFGVRCVNCTATRQLRINSAKWVATATLDSALQTGSGGMGKRWTQTPTALGYYHGDVGALVEMAGKTLPDGSLDLKFVGVGQFVFVQQDATLAVGVANGLGQTVTMTAPNHGFSNGQSVGFTGGTGQDFHAQFYTVANATANTFQIKGENDGQLAAGNGVMATGWSVTPKYGIGYYLGSTGKNSALWSDTEPGSVYALAGSSYPQATLAGKTLPALRPVLLKLTYDVTNEATEAVTDPWGYESWPRSPRNVVQMSICGSNCVDPAQDWSPETYPIRYDSLNYDPTVYPNLELDEILGKYAIFIARAGDQNSYAYVFVLDLTYVGPGVAAIDRPKAWVGGFATAKNHYSQYCGIHTTQTTQWEGLYVLEPGGPCAGSVVLTAPVSACNKGGNGTCDPCPNGLVVDGYDYSGKNYCGTVTLQSPSSNGLWDVNWGSQPGGFKAGDPVYTGGLNTTCPTNGIRWIKSLEAGSTILVNGEYMKILAATGSTATTQTFVVERGLYNDQSYLFPRDIAANSTAYVPCSATPRDTNPDLGGLQFTLPDFVSGTTTMVNHAFTTVLSQVIPNTSQYRGDGAVARVLPKYSIQRRTQDRADLRRYKPQATVTMFNKFAGMQGAVSDGNAIENHPSGSHVAAAQPLREWYFDFHPLLSGGLPRDYSTNAIGTIGNASGAAVQLNLTFNLSEYYEGAYVTLAGISGRPNLNGTFGVTNVVMNGTASGSFELRDANGNVVMGDGSAATGGTAKLKSVALVGGTLWDYVPPPGTLNPKHFDISPVSGNNVYYHRVNTIGQTAADHGKFCLSWVAGDCFAGAKGGHLYFNSKNIDLTHYWRCFGGEFSVLENDICIFSENPQGMTAASYFVPAQDSDVYLNGAAGRTISKQGWEPKGGAATGNVKPLTDGRWLMSRFWWAYKHSVAAFDPVRRDTFVPVMVSEKPVGADAAYVRFGYDAGFFCSANKDEACVAASGTVNETSPYSYVSVDGVTSVPCAAGCSIAIPGISGRMLFYQWVFLSGGVQVGVGRVETVAVE